MKKKNKKYSVNERSVFTYIGIAFISIVLLVGAMYLTWVLVAPAVDKTSWVETLKTKEAWTVPWTWFKDLF